MGRYRRNNNRNKSKKSKNESNKENGDEPANTTKLEIHVEDIYKKPLELWMDKSRKFNILEQELVLKYLNHYKDLATNQISSAMPEINVGLHVFPELTQVSLSSKPYLLLPPTLNSKERRCVHDLAVEAELYHESIGLRGAQRTAVVSPYANGFDELIQNGLLNYPTSIPILTCKPWFYTDHKETLQSYSEEIIGNHFNEENGEESNKTLAEIMSDTDEYNVEDETDDVEDVENDDNSDNPASDPENESHQQIHQEINSWSLLCKWHLSYERLRLALKTRPPQLMSECNDASDDIENDETISRDCIKYFTKYGSDQVWNMIDQPSTCIRDKDEFDFGAMVNDDLSTLVTHSIDDFPCLIVDSVESMYQCLEELLEQKPDVLGFDMEMYNISEYTCLTCLIQLSTKDKNYVIDVLSPGVWEKVSLLAPIFADPSIVKIGQSIGSMDVPSLYRDFGIFVVNAFDTYEAARKLNMDRVGLSAICEAYNLPTERSHEYKNLKKLYQTCDWRTRPLTNEMIRYGRFDVHYLIALRSLMIRDLTRGDLEGMNQAAEAGRVAKSLKSILMRGDSYAASEDGELGDSLEDSAYYSSNEQAEIEEDDSIVTTAAKLRMCASLMQVISLSQQRCLRFWKNKTETIRVNKTYAKAMSKRFDSKLCRTIVHWRQSVANSVKTMPGFVCSTDLVIAIVQKRPQTFAELKRLQFFLPELLQDENSPHVKDLLSLIQEYEEIEAKQDGNSNGVKHGQPFFSSVSTKSFALGVVAAAALATTVIFLGRKRKR